REDAFLHACAARCGYHDQRHPLLERAFGEPRELFAHHRAHAAAEEAEIEERKSDAATFDRAQTGEQRFVPSGTNLRFAGALRVGDRIAETERVPRLEVGVDLLERAAIREQHEPLVHGESEVVPALRADVQFALDLLAKDDVLAARTLDPGM